MHSEIDQPKAALLSMTCMVVVPASILIDQCYLECNLIRNTIAFSAMYSLAVGSVVQKEAIHRVHS